MAHSSVHDTGGKQFRELVIDCLTHNIDKPLNNKCRGLR